MIIPLKLQAVRPFRPQLRHKTAQRGRSSSAVIAKARISFQILGHPRVEVRAIARHNAPQCTPQNHRICAPVVTPPDSARPAIRIRDLQKTFGQLIAVDRVSVDIEPRRVLRHRRPVRLRQNHAAAHPRRPRNGDRRHHRGRHAGRLRPAGEFHGVPGRVDLSLDDGVEQRRLWPSHARRAGGRHQGAGRPLSRRHRADPFRRLLSAPALRRHEAARLDRARLRQRSGNPADGRAVLGARRAEQAAVAGRVAAHLGRAEEDRRVHHPQRRRGGVSRRPHHGDDGATRPREKRWCRCRWPRPRNLIELQKAPEFGELVHRIWSGLRDEVQRAREQEDTEVEHDSKEPSS